MIPASFSLGTVARCSLRLLAGFILIGVGFAQTPAPVSLPPPKRIPGPGLTLTDVERSELTAGAAALRSEIDALAKDSAGDSRVMGLLPDVEIFHKAVDWALRYDEFMAPKEIAFARQLLAQGHERAAQLRAKQAPWLDATGLVVRGYKSKLDGSIQPYGLLVPESVKTNQGLQPMMVWLLGRGEKRTELAFLQEREGTPPNLTPINTLVVIPYGRFCNATKFAGEVDVFEALAAVRAQYRIDPNRIAVAGFSMGGGSTWHLATHYAGLWAVASPGAGFAETPIFSRALAVGKEPRPAWEQVLWRQYESTGIAANLHQLPTLAYAGAIDPQKEASDLMEAAMQREGVTLERFIGPDTPHRYHPETKEALTKRLETLLAQGRDPARKEIWFSTYTLRYPELDWVRIEGMAKQWERADVHAQFTDEHSIEARTKNVTALAFPGRQAAHVKLDGQDVPLTGGELKFVLRDETWRQGEPAPGLHKRPGLTGPIDDAFMDAFVFVRPTGKPLNPLVGGWVEGELTAARTLWRELFRGDVAVIDDKSVTPDDLRDRNLILWGDPSSNAVLKKIIAQLPVHWDAKTLVVHGQTYDVANHAPILVFPNPLNPARYIVLNSGIDFRADAYGSNALQTPKLPDWAVIDLRTAPGPRWPGKVVSAGFFDESWADGAKEIKKDELRMKK
jgi:dienelactone hydrolase